MMREFVIAGRAAVVAISVRPHDRFFFQRQREKVFSKALLERFMFGFRVAMF
jgi:hypothetical protein